MVAMRARPNGMANVASAQPEQPQQHAPSTPKKAATAESSSMPSTT